jgi:uncharacterized membrane protein YeaQ/YmgE (transglycosylase-associated protein family)
MNFVLFILIGLIAGALAGRIVSGHGFGFVGDIVVGVIGAFLGGWLFSTFLGTAGGGGVLMSLVVAFIGAIVPPRGDSTGPLRATPRLAETRPLSPFRIARNRPPGASQLRSLKSSPRPAPSK